MFGGLTRYGLPVHPGSSNSKELPMKAVLPTDDTILLARYLAGQGVGGLQGAIMRYLFGGRAHNTVRGIAIAVVSLSSLLGLWTRLAKYCD